MISKLESVEDCIRYALRERAHMLNQPDDLDVCSRVRSLLGGKCPEHFELMAAVKAYRRQPPLEKILADPQLRAKLPRTAHHPCVIEVGRRFGTVAYLTFTHWGANGGWWGGRVENRGGVEEVQIGCGSELPYEEACRRVRIWSGIE